MQNFKKEIISQLLKATRKLFMSTASQKQSRVLCLPFSVSLSAKLDPEEKKNRSFSLEGKIIHVHL